MDLSFRRVGKFRDESVAEGNCSGVEVAEEVRVSKGTTRLGRDRDTTERPLRKYGTGCLFLS